MNGRRRIRLAAALCLCAAAGLAAAQEPDPFYTAMLREGTQELARGDAERALEDLRIGCFGLLEQPPLLAECLVRLSLAQAALDERDEFVATFRRLEEVEKRFQGYGAAALAAAERSAFEQKAVEWVAPQVLNGSPRFAALVERQREAELAALPEGKRVRELERRAAEEPGEPRWRLRLAGLELDRKRFAEALERLKGLPPAAGDGGAACLGGRALAGLERCAEAVAALAACPQRGREALLLEAELACLVELDRRDDARALLAAAPAPLAERPAIARLAARLSERSDPKSAAKPQSGAERKSGAMPAAAAPSRPTASPEARRGAPKSGPTAAATPSPKATATPAPTPVPAPELDSESAARIQEALALMRSARQSADLERALALARPIAAAHPERAELHQLVGEIAYRASRWSDCAAAYLRAGAAGPQDPTQRFYMAVCLYESGDRASAATIAASGLEKLPRSPFVDGYLRRIHGALP